MKPLPQDHVGLVLDALDAGVILIDREAVVVAWNAWLAAATGIPARDAVGKTLDALFPGIHLRRLMGAIRTAFESGSSSLLTHTLGSAPLPLKTRAGRPLLHNMAVRPLGERPWSLCVVQITDVTDAVYRERVLRDRLNARYHAVLESAPDAILTLDAEARIQLANPAAARQLGYSPDELLNRPLASLLTDPSAWGDMWSTVLDEGTVKSAVEMQARRKDGSLSYLELSASRWTSSPNVFVTVILRDVTERRAAEDALRSLTLTLERRVEERTAELMQAEEQLRQAQKMEAVGQLTGGIAHDFNNLLAGIVGSLDLLQTRLQQGRTDTIERYVTAAMSSAQRAAALTHRLLAFARRQPLDPKPVDANRLVASMEDLLRRTIGPAVRLNLAMAGDLWPILCDPNQLESAILNLAINARDAMPGGGELLIETGNVDVDAAHAATEPGVTPGHYVAICVTDTGTGMPPDVIARAFDPFFTTKPIGQGTGLGLSMIYGFANQSEGYARIVSEEGRGTTIKLYLPRFRGRVEEESASAMSPAVPKSETGETVLIVEDEPVVRGLIVEVLEDLGYRTLEAADGPAGLKILQSKQPIDLLVTDVGLPGVNGRQVADQAREWRPDLKVLFITGYAENATRAAGFLDFGMEMLTKPFAVEALGQRVRSILAQRKQG